jgi:hypothetical protein
MDMHLIDDDDENDDKPDDTDEDINCALSLMGFATFFISEFTA